MGKRLGCLLSIGLWCLSTAVYAQTNEKTVSSPINVLTFPIPLMVESDSKGLFIDLIHAIAAEADLTVNITVKNTPRALRAFAAGEYDLLMPALDTMFTDMQHVIRSNEVFYLKRDYVFTLKQQPIIDDIAQLRGLRVGLTSAYAYARELLNEPGINLIYVDTDEQNAMLLSKGRIDAFVVEESSGIQAFRNTGLIGDVHYASSKWISEQEVYFAVYNSARGVLLEKRVSSALNALKKSGMFAQIMAGSETGL